jgi:hypothetical protein
LVSVVGLPPGNKTTTNNKWSNQMRAKRMLMGAAVIGCLAATMPSGAYAQEANSRDQINARTGQQPVTNARPSGSMRQRQGADGSAQLGARANNETSANRELERRGPANESRMRVSARESRGYTARPGMRSERSAYARVSEERYGRGWRGERAPNAGARVEGGYAGERLAYRNRAVDAGAGVAAADYSYRGRRLYAYAPTYQAGYTTGPYYNYAPGYDVAVSPGPYYAPGWNLAYAGPYYDYAPGVSVGVGIGPVGIGLGPAWAW